MKQECIPVGCVPTAAVAAIRCQNWEGVLLGGGVPTSMGEGVMPVYFHGWYLPLGGVCLTLPQDGTYTHTLPGRVVVCLGGVCLGGGVFHPPSVERRNDTHL